MLFPTHQTGKNPSVTKPIYWKAWGNRLEPRQHGPTPTPGNPAISIIFLKHMCLFTQQSSLGTQSTDKLVHVHLTSAWGYPQTRHWRPSGSATWAGWVNSGAFTEFSDERDLQENSKCQKAKQYTWGAAFSVWSGRKKLISVCLFSVWRLLER